MSAPCALVVSCSDFLATELVKQILGTETLPEANHITENIDAYSWHINTKYYTADINLCTTPVKTIGNEEFAQCVEAVIIHFDSTQKTGLESVRQWLPFIDPYEPAVQMLVCDKLAQDTGISHLQAQEWCLDNSFELVELNPDDNDSDNDDSFAETTGIKRIIQALHAHTWANLELKENPFRPPRLESIGADSTDESKLEINCLEDKQINDSSLSSVISTLSSSDSSISGNSLEDPTAACSNSAAPAVEAVLGDTPTKASKEKSNISEKLDAMLEDDLTIFQALENEDPDGQSFEQLFERFRILKEKAETLPFEERRVYAEKVTLAFWRAIGGDEEEIKGLDVTD